jgi:hypothetical protein
MVWGTTLEDMMLVRTLRGPQVFAGGSCVIAQQEQVMKDPIYPPRTSRWAQSNCDAPVA